MLAAASLRRTVLLVAARGSLPHSCVCAAPAFSSAAAGGTDAALPKKKRAQMTAQQKLYLDSHKEILEFAKKWRAESAIDPEREAQIRARKEAEKAERDAIRARVREANEQTHRERMQAIADLQAQRHAAKVAKHQLEARCDTLARHEFLSILQELEHTWDAHPDEMINRGYATGDNIGYYTRYN